MAQSSLHILVWICIFVIPFSVYWPLSSHQVPGVLTQYVTPGLYLSDFVALILILYGYATWRAKSTTTRKKYRYRGPLFIAIPLLSIVVLAITSVFHSLSPGLAGYTAFRWLLSLMAYLALLELELPTSAIAKPLVISLAIQVLIGICQIIRGGPVGIPGESALWVSEPNAALVSIKSFSLLRAYGMTFHPNVFGGWLFVGLILCLPLLVRPVWRIVWGLLCVGLLTTFSRSAWMAAGLILPIACVGLYLHSSEFRRPILYTIGPVVVIGIIAGLIFRDQLLTRLQPSQSLSEYTSLRGREELIALASSLVRQYPIFGIGVGNFPLAQLIVVTLDQPHYVHNIPLLLASETGIAGGMVWFWMWLRPIFTLNHAWKRNLLWLWLAILAWAGIGLIGLWDFYPWELESGRWLSIILLAMISRELIIPRSIY